MSIEYILGGYINTSYKPSHFRKVLYISYICHMKNLIIILILSLSFLVGCNSDDTPKCDCVNLSISSKTSNDTVTICHVIDNGDNVTIEVDSSSLDWHLSHGDIEGACPTLGGGNNYAIGEQYKGNCNTNGDAIRNKDTGNVIGIVNCQ